MDEKTLGPQSSLLYLGVLSKENNIPALLEMCTLAPLARKKRLTETARHLQTPYVSQYAIITS